MWPLCRVPPSGRKAYSRWLCLLESPLFSAFPWVLAVSDMTLIVMNLIVCLFVFIFQGRKAKDIINTARASLAKMIGGKPQDIIFTSGGTEVKLQPLPAEPEGAVGYGRSLLLASSF